VFRAGIERGYSLEWPQAVAALAGNMPLLSVFDKSRFQTGQNWPPAVVTIDHLVAA